MGLRAVKQQVLGLLADAGPLPEVDLTGQPERLAMEPPDSVTPLTPVATVDPMEPDNAAAEGDEHCSAMPALLPELLPLPRPAVLKVLISLLCQNDPALRWRAVSLLGPLVADLAEDDLEAARVVMRRFMWSLNDESGGIGWGVPEAMAECLAVHPGLAREYIHILVSFMREDGFYLEYPPLQRGLMWALGRLAAGRRQPLREHRADRYLPPYLASPDAIVRGLSARVCGRLLLEESRPALQGLLGQSESVVFYQRERLLRATVGDLAVVALAALPSAR